MTRIGVLALQGDFREHLLLLESLGVAAVPVKTPAQLAEVDALVIPGGESTTIGKMATRFGLIEPLRESIDEGLPTYGTCAGLILLAGAVTEGDQPLIGALDVVVRRNAFGRQNESFEADLEVSGLDRPFHAVFIRAPAVERTGTEVEVLATHEGRPVLVRQGTVMAAAFHPELSGDRRLHQCFLQEVKV